MELCDLKEAVEENSLLSRMYWKGNFLWNILMFLVSIPRQPPQWDKPATKEGLVRPHIKRSVISQFGYG